VSEGYIKLYRQTLDNPVVCKDADYFAVWCYLLLSATHSEMEVMFNGKKITLKKGQLITGRKSIVKVFNLSESKVQRILKSFEIEQQIEQQTTPNGRLITVLNWDMYQANEQPNEQRVNNDRTTNEQRVNTNKNVKNVKNVKKDITIRDLLVDFSPEFQSAFMDYSEMRTKIKKPLTVRAAQMALSKLQELSKSEAEQIAIINQSVFHSWQGLFELKDKLQQQNQSAGYGYEGMDKL
jgi:molybdopterin-biosynthesis enzyme MoeA-like protein